MAVNKHAPGKSVMETQGQDEGHMVNNLMSMDSALHKEHTLIADMKSAQTAHQK